MKSKNLKQIILDEMLSDDGYTMRDDANIIKDFRNLDAIGKIQVNSIFISLTGYSLETLISKYKSEVK